MEVEGCYRDIRIGDKELEVIEDEEQEMKKRKVPIYGGVEVEESATKPLQNHPKLALWPKLDMTNIMTEVEKGCVKWSWAEMSKKKTEEEEETIIVNDESEGTQHEDATGTTTASDSYTVDLRKIRVTKLPTNRRAIIPDQQGPQVEQHLQHLKA